MSRERVIAFPAFRGAVTGSDARTQQAAQNHAVTFLLCLASLTIFRLVANLFSNTDLFFDEAQYWFWSRELAFGYFSKPPLIGWIIRAATEICGQGEACIRAPSPIFHAATAMVVYAIGRKLYDTRIGFWAGLTYATLPGVSLSSSLISTDALLLFFVALALFAFLKLRQDRKWDSALLFGVAIGFGFLSKYAMAYFLICLGIWLLWSRSDRVLLRDPRLYAGLAIGAAILAPNILWNARNGFATLSHTADNANWGGSLIHPVDLLEFAGGQFGVFGPILFSAFVVFCINRLRSAEHRGEAGETERLLLTFSGPVLLLMSAQALLSRAHANWAAFAYIAATVLITAVLLRDGWFRLFRASFTLHLAIVMLIAVGGILAGKAALPGADPYTRLLGWKALAESAAAKANEGGFQAIATDKRALAAELLYYMRDRDIPVVAMREDGPPRDHFQLTRPLDENTPRPVLLVSFDQAAGAQPIGEATIAAGSSKTRKVYYYRLDFEPKP